jgi:mono/diheme cytochrome c family protein
MQVVKSISLAAVALSLSTVAAFSADAEHGRDLAKRWCASCHVVSPDQKSASADVPPFATIAESPNFDPKRLAYFLLEPHPKMPQMALGRSAADDIAAYIQSLKR